MVLLGGLELVAAGYIIHKHQKNKRERRRLAEEADALEAERQNSAGPSSRRPRRRTHSHDGRATQNSSRRDDTDDSDDDGDDYDHPGDPHRRGRNSRPKPQYLDPTHAGTQPIRPSSVPPDAYPSWDQSQQAQYPYVSAGPAPAYTHTGGPPFHPDAGAPSMAYKPDANTFPPPSSSGGGSNQDYYGYVERNMHGNSPEKRGAETQRNTTRRGSYERVSGRPERVGAGAETASPHVRFSLPRSDASDVDRSRRGRRGHDEYDGPPPAYTET